jgi:peptidoglycan-N-acetylglucosamine deacetylase
MEKIHWPDDCRAAISLTYDDGISNHPAVVAPQLEAHGVRGTFYAPLSSDILAHPLDWRKMAQRGHEIGNHTVFHPCRNVRGKYDSWLPEANNLVNYDAERWLDEINTANQALFLIDDKHERTFGNTCFDNFIGPEDAPICLEPLIEQVFVAARGENTGKPVNLDSLNFNNLGTIWGDRRALGDFSPELNGLLDTGGWIIYTFHGVGPVHNHSIAEEEHLRLVDFLGDNRDKFWIAPVIEVAKFLQKNR